jgi:hypothetical protein
MGDQTHTLLITTKSDKGDLIMTDFTIHNFRYFLEELEKNLRQMNVSLDQASVSLESMHVLYCVMAKMCENWSNQLEHRQ